jgi:CheY-like chemotaxis protein
MELELRDLDVERVIEDALILVREQAAERGQTVALDVDPDVPQARGDERRIKQVVANLLGNAVKFTPAGGRIVVGARCVDDTVQVFVSDNGIGVAAGDQERIFEAFSQAGAGPQPKTEGTGLGLTLSRQIVELHGGRLWLESRAGEGSTFTFSLPTRSSTTTPVTAAPDRPGADARVDSRTVLLVEDDEHSIELLSLYLRDSGFDVVVARSGEEGLARARRVRPQGIVLDILLPGLDGWEFLARSKVDPAIAEIPVIIVSMVDERGRGLALGAADYLVKPIARGDLLGALSRVTGASQATVLTIDDDPTALELAHAVLEPAGYIVLTARTGGKGVALARSAQPDVILLDLVMPEVDGFAVVEQLRADLRTSSIPIVVLTSKTLTTEDERRLRGRIASLARKGELDRRALLDLLERCILVKAP